MSGQPAPGRTHGRNIRFCGVGYPCGVLLRGICGVRTPQRRTPQNTPHTEPSCRDSPTLFVMPALPLPRAAGAGGKPSLPLPPAAAGNILQDETRRQKECVDACAKLCAGKHGCSIMHAICRRRHSQLEARTSDGVPFRGPGVRRDAARRC